MACALQLCVGPPVWHVRLPVKQRAHAIAVARIPAGQQPHVQHQQHQQHVLTLSVHRCTPHLSRMDDPLAHKPDGWDDRRLIADPHLTKPEGWLDHELPEVPDPGAVKPDDWDESSQGVWLPPPIKNPACVGAPGCGPWKAPLVSNPKYKGPWIAPQVKNPDYKVGAQGVECPPPPPPGGGGGGGRGAEVVGVELDFKVTGVIRATCSKRTCTTHTP
jgi:hypothetical protein